MPLRSASCPICGADRKACGSANTDHLDPVDIPDEEPAMARSKGKLVRVKRTTDAGTEYYEKVRQEDASTKARSAPDSGVVSTPKAVPRTKA